MPPKIGSRASGHKSPRITPFDPTYGSFRIERTSTPAELPPMKNNQRIAFVLSVMAVAGLLAASSYDVKKVAGMRWEYSLRQEKGLKEEISAHCHVLTAKENTIAEKFFLDKFSPPPLGENSKT